MKLSKPTKSSPQSSTDASARPMPKMPKWGWLEILVVSQTLFPAMMFIPALLPFRFLTRVGSFLLPLAAWAYYFLKSQKVAGGRTYLPAIPLAFAMGWLTLSIVHPNVNTLNSAVCAVAIAVAVFCPVFWAPAAITDTRQLARLMTLMLLCNGASALMGMAQVYRPDTFRPPKIVIFEINPDIEGSLMVEKADGTKYLRPPGLTDSPGGAAMGGIAACGFGLAMALAPVVWWKRFGGLMFAMVGLMILFYSQVRSLTITLFIGIVFWAFLLLIRREFRKLTMLVSCAAIIGVASIGWIMREGGSIIFDRFVALFDDNVSTTYYKNRGAFIEYAMSEYLPKFPLGAGPGRVGMASFMFGNVLSTPDNKPLYAETQVEIWIFDGGIPLLILYPLALVIAMGAAVRTAVKCPDAEISYWAGATLVYAASVMIAVMGGQPFMSPMGVQFWALLGAVYGAQEKARVDAIRAAAKARIAAP